MPGTLIGAIGGYILLPRIIFNAYAANSTLTNLKLNYGWSYLLIAIVIALVATYGATLSKLQATEKSVPAELLLPKPPKNGSRIMLERIKPLWRKLSFNHKVTARNLFRYKGRGFMTIFGVAGCTALLVMGFGIRDSLMGISKQQYSNIIRYDMIAVNKNDLSGKQSQRLQTRLDNHQIKRSTPIYYQQMSRKLGSDHVDQQINMIVPEHSSQFNRYIRLYQRSGKKCITLNNDGVVISEKLASLLHAKVGSKIRLKDANDHYRTFRVAGITDMYMGHFVMMNQHEYRKVFHRDYQPNCHLITLRHHSNRVVRKQAQKLIQTGAIKGVNLNTSDQQTINNLVKSLNTVIGVLIGIATILAIVVIYVLTNTNVEERMRELSTLKVLGFYDDETTMYIYRETIILSVLGILLGYLIGIGLHRFIIVSLPPTNAMFDPTMKWTNFALSAVIPAVITAILAGVVYRHIKTVDMLDALESVE